MKDTSIKRQSLCLCRRKKAFVLSFLLTLLTFLPCKSDTTVFQQIIDNVVERELQTSTISSSVSSTRSYMSSIQSDGSWADIDYSSTAQTNWAPVTHLDRLRHMAIAYVSQESSLCGDTALYTDIVNGLNYWYTKKPTSTNWYMYEIGWPQRMGVILCLMRKAAKQVPSTTEQNILAWQKSISKGPNQSGSQGTGANKMDIALQWIYRTALQEDQTNLDFAVDQFFLPIKFNSGEGLQSDYSYLQHGPQLSVGAYGNSVLTAMIKVVYYLEGTTYAEQGDYMDYISKFVRLAYLPSVRGQYMSYNNVGRSVGGKGGTARSSFATITAALASLDAQNATEYNNATLRLQGKASAGYALPDYHRHFWRSDYTIHQRGTFSMDVRTASTRTYRCENGNGTNLKGYFMTEGGTWISQTGKEYADISVVWDWAHLPGTTVPAVSSIPQPAQWGTYGQSTFTGGVSDGVYGATAYKMNNTEYSIGTQANKSWFFFDKEVVCLGSGIKSTNACNVHTTINQCYLNGTVTAEKASGISDIISSGEHGLDSTLWVNHDGISYYFPNGASNLNVRNDAQSGTWKSIDSSSSDTQTYTKNVFKMWLDHGNKPTAASYAYFIVPNTNTIESARGTIDTISLLNTDSVQAVYNKSLQIIQAIFYRSCKMRFDSIEVAVSNPCAVMFRNVDTKEVKTYVSDPSYGVDSLTIYAKFPSLSYKQAGCKFNVASQYVGSTVDFVINEASTDSVYISVEAIVLDKEELTLNAQNMYAELNATTSPANVTRPGLTWKSSNENVIKVDNNGHVMALRSGTANVTVESVDGVSASCSVTVDEGLATAYTTADAYVYDGQKTTNYGTATSLVVRKDGTGYCRGAYVRFPMSALDSLDATDGSLNVKLVLSVKSGAEKVNEVHWTIHSLKTYDWNETTVTWNNGPSTLATLATQRCFIPGSVWKDNYVEFDVTSYALSQYQSGASDLSVYIYQNARATGGKGTSSFYSRENGNALLSPRLVVSGNEKAVGINTVKSATGKARATLKNEELAISTTAAAKAVLYDVQGQVVEVFTIPAEGDYTFRVDGLQKGVYLLRVNNETIKLLK